MGPQPEPAASLSPATECSPAWEVLAGFAGWLRQVDMVPTGTGWVWFMGQEQRCLSEDAEGDVT